ncbi:DUF3574 domain-containing protein [Altericista sp. CCNU0014]|uniref:DUF3574 domain-containing protein n=1 Tax=Altericista sp. CCNU0014 TaxID=3082949 RepID=UPI00384EC635
MEITNVFTQSLILAGLALIHAANFGGFATRGSPAIERPHSAETTQVIESGDRQVCKTVPSHSVFARTELFFGLGKSNGSEVTEAEFQSFLSREVTPRFPDGLTLLSGRGQFKDSGGSIDREPFKLLILLYPIEKFARSSQSVEQIRQAYKTVFQQESVLRTDGQSCISF